MSTQIVTAEERAEEKYPRKLWPEGTLDEVRRQRQGYAKAIREVAEPLERENAELRESVQVLVDAGVMITTGALMGQIAMSDALSLANSRHQITPTP